MLVPNNKQRTKLNIYAGASRFAYNWALAKQMDSLKAGNDLISDSELRKEFTKLKRLPEYSWLNEISNNVTKQAIKDLCEAFKRYFKLKKQSGYKPYSKKFLAHMKRIGKQPTVYQQRGHPKFKSKKNTEKYSFYQDIYKIKFSETHVKVEGFTMSHKRNKQKINYIRLAEHNRIPVNTKYYNPRITFDGINWWISVSVETDDTKAKPVLNNKGIGIDLGIKDLAICSDGVRYSNINKTDKIKKFNKRKRRLQRSTSRSYEMNKQKGKYCKTKNVIKKEHKLLQLNHKLTNIRHNYIHQMTSEIINRKPRFICIEDLNVQGMMSNKYLSKAVQEQCFYEIKQQLTYKTIDNQIPLIIADRWYPSSKRCNCCGNIKHDLKLHHRIYKCDCGYENDRDDNSSLNLEDYGYKMIS